jgi:2'-5' RNA ligase
MNHSPDKFPVTGGAAASSDVRRLFFALWPPAEVAEELSRLTRGLLAGHGRAVPAANVHLTLAFLGPADPEQQTCYLDRVEGWGAAGFPITLDTVGYWRRSGILWAGCSQDPENLRALVARLNERLIPCGFAPDTRPFRVHFTLARHVRRYAGTSRGGKVASVMKRERVDPMPPLSWHANEFTLVESQTLPGGARYRVLRAWPLS